MQQIVPWGKMVGKFMDTLDATNCVVGKNGGEIHGKFHPSASKKIPTSFELVPPCPSLETMKFFSFSFLGKVFIVPKKK